MRLLLIIAFLFADQSAWAGEPIISKSEMAHIMGYPEARLIVTENVTEKSAPSMSFGFGKHVLSFFSYESENKSFAGMGVAVAKAGTMLDPETKQYFEKLLSLKPDSSGPMARRIEVKGKYAGYVGVFGFGAGGTGYRAMITIPSEHVDVGVVISLPNDSNLTVTPDTAKYNEAVIQEGKFALDRLTECVEYAANQLLTKEYTLKLTPELAPTTKK